MQKMSICHQKVIGILFDCIAETNHIKTFVL